MKRLNYYIKMWFNFAKYSFSAILNQRLSFTIFFIGKVIRFLMYFLFLSFLLHSNQILAGLTGPAVLFIFLTYCIIDVTAQFLFREVYRFRSYIVSGSFDLVLTKPLSPLFRSLLSGTDIIDFATLPPLIILLIIQGSQFSPTFLQVILYISLVINGIIIAASLHIFVLAIGILTTEIDHMVMIYRDVSTLGRFPTDIYKEPLRSFLTFIIPVTLMVTVPGKSLLQLLDPLWIAVAFIFGVGLLFIALKFWNYALLRYSSASS